MLNAKRSRECHGAADAATLALQALGWLLGDPSRAQRFLALTGLSPDDLRDRIGDADLHIAILSFLAGHEPDLIACAEAIGIAPDRLVAASSEFRP